MARLPGAKGTAVSQEKFQPKSSFLENAEYDAESDAMTLTFKSGSQYRYSNVGRSTWMSFQQSPDHSSYYARVIKARLNAVPIVRKVVGFKKSQPLQKQTKPRSLESHGLNPIRSGVVLAGRAGTIPSGLYSS